jgi:hypothetical protein
VFEYFGIHENEISCSLHWGKDYGLPKPDYNLKTKVLKGNFDDRWMVWSCEISPTKIIWRLDGKKVYESREGIPADPMYMIANVAVKDRPEHGNKVDETGLPYVMEIDYVKIYKPTSK